jgi:hypothetical protein
MNLTLIALAVARVCRGFITTRPAMSGRAYRGAGGRIRSIKRG